MIKVSVSSYSFGGNYNSTEEGVIEMIEKAAKMGFDGIEFIEGALCTPEKAHIIKEKCEEVGITPVAFCVGANFAIADKAASDAEVERVCRFIDTTKEMGATLLRHDVAYGPIKKGTGYDYAIPFMAENIRRVTEYAAKEGVRTMTENHGFFSQDALRVEKLINAVGHENFGALVDIGNFMCADEDPVKSVGVMAPYAFHVHCKDFYFKPGTDVNPGDGWFRSRGGNYLRGTVIGFGAAKASQSIGILKRAGYDGYMTVEFEGGEDAMWGIRVGKDNILRFLGE